MNLKEFKLSIIANINTKDLTILQIVIWIVTVITIILIVSAIIKSVKKEKPNKSSNISIDTSVISIDTSVRTPKEFPKSWFITFVVFLFICILAYFKLENPFKINKFNWREKTTAKQNYDKKEDTEISEKIVELIAQAYDIPFKEIQEIANHKKVKTEEDFYKMFCDKYDINIPLIINTYTNKIEIPNGTTVKIPIAVTKNWSRQISIIDWHITYNVEKRMVPNIEFLFDSGQRCEKHVRFVSIKNKSGEKVGIYYNVLSDDSNGDEIPNGWQGNTTVELKIPNDYDIPEGYSVKYIMFKKKVRK